MKISFITTVYNEERSIRKFIDSVLKQTLAPNEIIIVDGGSLDKTFPILKELSRENKKIKVILKKGNRSVGRNEAVRKAIGDIIACSDSGNILDKNWVKNITKPFEDSNVDVVAGYYKGAPITLFQKCLVPFVLVMPDKVNQENFLPATRSIALKKSIWKKVGGFDKEYSHNEDYVFANKLKYAHADIKFAPDAIANWIPRRNFKQAFIMFFRFAYGDGESGIIRDKVLILFARYLLFFYLISLLGIYKSIVLAAFIVLGMLLYLLWAGFKNYRYVEKIKGIPILILLQLTSDIAVLAGTTFGVSKRIFNKVPSIISENKTATLLIVIYILTILSIIEWGIPNRNHPFLYHMDEWHQSQAVRTTFTKGTPNTEGSANGTMFQFYLSGLYLFPFIVAKIVNPFAIKTAISALEMQHRLFIIFRLNTLLFGVGSMILIGSVSKKFFKIPSSLSIFLFSATPIWYSLSNYFKYDIALIFWIILSMLFMFEYCKNPTRTSFILASVASALACATKISAAPLLPLLLGAFFIGKNRKDYYTFLLGTAGFIIVFLFTGIPDIIFQKGNILRYLYYNVFTLPQISSSNQTLLTWNYLFLKIYPIIFGPALLITALTGLIFIILRIIRRKSEPNIILLLLAFSLFFISLIPLKFSGTGNRTLVLLPFLTLLSGFALTKIIPKYFHLLLIFCVFIQIYFLAAVLYPKFQTDTRELTSRWMMSHIPKESKLGINVPPIYEFAPDMVLKEYYERIYNPKTKTNFIYLDLMNDNNLKSEYAVISNADFNRELTFDQKRNDLIQFQKKGYKKITEFKPSFLSIPFVNDKDIYMAGLTAMPYSLTVYSRK